MRAVVSIALLTTLGFLAASDARPQNSAHPEKVAEGEYWQWQDGRPIKDSSQTWTIWRTQDGYEVEDKLPPDKAAALMAVMGAALQKNMSPELRGELQNAATATDIHLQLTGEGAVRALLVNGKKISEVKQVQVANCSVRENEISCKGRQGTAHLKNPGQGPAYLLVSVPFIVHLHVEAIETRTQSNDPRKAGYGARSEEQTSAQ